MAARRGPPRTRGSALPELPEVEVVRRGLEQGVVGRTIETVTVAHERAIRRHLAGPGDFVALLAGRTVLSAGRRGKYLWFPMGTPTDSRGAAVPANLSPADPASAGPACPAGPGNASGADRPGGAPASVPSGEVLVGHLGMSGQLLVVDPAKPPEPHLRVRFTFTDGGRELRFVDQRTFGGLFVVDGDAAAPADAPRALAHIARDPLDPAFSDSEFAAALRRRHTGVKRALLDQTLIGGIGNIYADEALWRARLHYARATETLTRREVASLLEGVREVLTAALAAGGTSFDSLYVSVNGVSGLFDRSLEVYGREGEPCSRCGTPIRRDAFMNRSSYTCPHCQPRPRRGRW